MKLKNRQDFLVALTIGVVALYVGVNFILSPLGDWWSSRQKEIGDLRDRIKNGNNLLSRDTWIRNNWDTKRANALPTDNSLAEQQLEKSFAGWSADSGAQITSISLQWKSDSTNYMTLGSRVEASGNLGTLSRFIYDVERGPVALRLDTVELDSHDNLGQQLTLGLEVDGLALLQQPQPTEKK